MQAPPGITLGTAAHVLLEESQERSLRHVAPLPQASPTPAPEGMGPASGLPPPDLAFEQAENKKHAARAVMRRVRAPAIMKSPWRQGYITPRADALARSA